MAGAANRHLDPLFVSLRIHCLLRPSSLQTPIPIRPPTTISSLGLFRQLLSQQNDARQQARLAVVVLAAPIYNFFFFCPGMSPVCNKQASLANSDIWILTPIASLAARSSPSYIPPLRCPRIGTSTCCTWLLCNSRGPQKNHTSVEGRLLRRVPRSRNQTARNVLCMTGRIMLTAGVAARLR
ncbi:hypothetical protein LY76DRAFT_418861 [Colletotrichum caudatum]|nr:hypothetical protein LY76DRAFT_418861 [Colletotrichum caudatum]